MTIDLKGTWNLCSNNGNIKDVPFTLPGDIHSALLSKNIIPDPYYGCNEKDIQWVGKEDWTAERTFCVTPNFQAGRQFLILESADTFVRIFINKKEIGFCTNYFCKWRFDITENLKEGTNTIKLVFESAEKHAEQEAKKSKYPIPDSKAPIYSPHRNFVRKTQCHGGWDWGPCIMASGIYDSIRIEQTSSGFIDYAVINSTPISKDLKEWNTDITITYTALQSGKKTFSILLTPENTAEHPDLTENSSIIRKTFQIQLQKGENTFTQSITVKNPELWYAAGCRPEDTDHIISKGEPTFTENKLYSLSIQCGKSKLSKKISFRTLEVVAQEDEHGKSLFFKINNRAIFAKGSNWIPADALPSRQTPAKYEQLLSALVKANQNFIRVWGGGQYEKEIFYELCDRKGILVWQDCMFACSLYPSEKKFLDSVRQEIRHQVRRLQSHSCIALWCGNNELVGALNWYEESKTNRDRYIIDYDRLTEGVLAKEIQALDPNRTWWPSSPSAGQDDYSDNWHSDGRGDMHYWSVWHEGKPFEAYYDIQPRFVSEFGYQSFPSFESVKTYAPESQYNLTSPVMEFHQCNLRGNSIIIENFSRYFRFPTSFSSMLYLSQVQQAKAIKTAIDYWRTLRPICMGSLIWQLNDVWPVASWSSIEYSGKWKILHYASKEFFSPLYLSIYKKNGKIKAFLINDTEKPVKENVSIKYIDFSGCIKETFEINTQVASDSVLQIFEKDVSEIPPQCFIFAQWGNRTPQILFSEEPKNAELEKPEIKWSIKQLNDENSEQPSSFEITLITKKPAFYVNLEAIGLHGTFSKNMLSLIPGSSEKIVFTAEAYTTERGLKALPQKITLKRFENAFSVMSLRDSY